MHEIIVRLRALWSFLRLNKWQVIMWTTISALLMVIILMVGLIWMFTCNDCGAGEGLYSKTSTSIALTNASVETYVAQTLAARTATAQITPAR